MTASRISGHISKARKLIGHAAQIAPDVLGASVTDLSPAEQRAALSLIEEAQRELDEVRLKIKESGAV